MSGKILVVGATGNIGRALVDQLVAKGETVKAASRNATPLAGAEAVRFDYADTATFGPALEGVDRAYVLLPTGYLNVVELMTPLITAAAERNIKVVMQSVLGVDADDSIPYRQVELFLERSGTPYVILRPNWFADNFHTFWLEGIRQGIISVPAADQKSSFIDVRDIAASAAAALTTDRFDGCAFNLTGPEAYSYAQAAEILSTVTGREIAYKASNDENFVATLVGAGVPADYAGFLASIFHPVRQGWTAGVSPDVETLTGSKPRSVLAYAQDNAKAFAA